MTAHHDECFITKWIFSTDHKMSGIQYALGAMSFLLFGFGLMLVMRWQLAYPGTAIPIIGKMLTQDGIMSPELYNQFGAMHGTIMIFLGVVPLSVGAFGNFFLPLQIGAEDMAFPKLNMASFWVFFIFTFCCHINLPSLKNCCIHHQLSSHIPYSIEIG